MVWSDSILYPVHELVFFFFLSKEHEPVSSNGIDLSFYFLYPSPEGDPVRIL